MGMELPLKGAQPPFSVHVYRGQTVGWMKTPLSTEVDLGPGHTVLDGVPALRERGTAAPLFSAHVYCGHGRPSPLLLSSCLDIADFEVPPTMTKKASRPSRKFARKYSATRTTKTAPGEMTESVE